VCQHIPKRYQSGTKDTSNLQRNNIETTTDEMLARLVREVGEVDGQLAALVAGADEALARLVAELRASVVARQAGYEPDTVGGGPCQTAGGAQAPDTEHTPRERKRVKAVRSWIACGFRSCLDTRKRAWYCCGVAFRHVLAGLLTSGVRCDKMVSGGPVLARFGRKLTSRFT